MPLAEALVELQRLTERLRRECPWDREQTERTIVPHTVEEAYEVADAAVGGDDAKLLDELGDLLFQVYFLAHLLEERDAGDLETVARAVHEKLIRSHPHVFGDLRAATAAEVLSNWDRIKGEERRSAGKTDRSASPLDRLPRSMPALLRAAVVRKSSNEKAVSLPPVSADEVGDRLLLAVESAIAAGLDPEAELERALRQRLAAEAATL